MCPPSKKKSAWKRGKKRKVLSATKHYSFVAKQNKTILFYMCLMLMPISFLRLSFTRLGLIEERKMMGDHLNE